MNEIKKVYLVLKCIPIFIVFFIIFIILIVVDSSNGNSSGFPINGFNVPFKDDVVYSISSPFGDRKDPINKSSDFHDGIDLVVPLGTEIVASASGVVIKTGYHESLGNYVFLEHNLDGVIYYTSYAHMQDNSIIVEEGQIVYEKDKLGIVGDTGRTTGVHLHFSLMSPQLKFDKDNLKDPTFIFEKEELFE